MIIVQPSVKVLAYSQLNPLATLEMPSEIGRTHKVITSDPCSELARITEICGRISWKSEDKMEKGSADGFCVRVVNIRKDKSIAEHAHVTMRFVTDRYVTHQLVRHRIAAYTQESTHYINYTKRGEEIAVCEPMGVKKHVPSPCSACGDGDVKMLHHTHDHWPLTLQYQIWQRHCEKAEADYFELIRQGVHHKHARYVLPSCLKTEIAVTYNLNMWLHVISLRATPANTPEIAHLFKLAGVEMAKLCPEIFGEYFPKEEASIAT